MSVEPLSNTDYLKAVSEGLVDLSKDMAGDQVKEALAKEFLSGVAQSLLVEGSKAVVGVTGRLILAVIFKQFDQTASRLRTLEHRLDEQVSVVFSLAKRKFDLAINYPTSGEAAAYRVHLLHEARAALELASALCESKIESTLYLDHAAFLCAIELPGGLEHSKVLLKKCAAAATVRQRVLSVAADRIAAQAKKERYDTVQVQVGEKPITPRYVARAMEFLPDTMPIYEARQRETTGPRLERAKKLELLAAETRLAAHSAQNLIAQAQVLVARKETPSLD